MSRSEYFRTMLAGYFLENSMKEIEITQISPEILPIIFKYFTIFLYFLIICRYLYTGNCDIQNSQALELMKAIDSINLRGRIFQICENVFFSI